jgi:hypothetical protein
MNKPIHQIGFWSGFMAFVSTTAYVIVQLLQVAGALRYPLDEILIYGTSLCIGIPFILEILALHYITPVEKSFGAMPLCYFRLLMRYLLPQIM